MSRPLRYGSVCSGIEAASVAWEPLGWEPAWFCEIDPFASALLTRHYPRVPNHGDFTKLLDPTHPVHAEPIDVLVGGTPCQDFSVAGLRAGIEGDRGSLTLDFCRLVGVLRPEWVVWENVPGVLSSDGGRAFGALLGALGELGYGFAWRVLDAQYFGLAQRRKRVFVVGCAGAQSSRAGAVLLEPESVRGNPPSRRKAREETPADAGGRAAEPGGHVVAPPLTATNDPSRSPQSAEVTAQVAAVVQATMGGQSFAFNGYARTVGDVATPLMAEDYKKVEIGVLVPMAPTLRATPHANTWANGGGHVGIVNVEHGLHSSGNLDIREVSEPITASERKGHSVVLQPDTLGFYPTGGTHGVSAIEDRSPTLKLGSGQGGNAPGVCFKASHFTRGKDGAPSEISPPLSADADRGDQDTLVFDTTQITSPLNYSSPRVGDPCHPLAAGADPPTIATLSFKAVQSEAAGGTFVTEEFSPTLQAQNNGSTAVPAILQTSAMSVRAAEAVDVKQVQWASGGGKMENDTAQTLRSGAEHNYQFARINTQVRRLTPRECERLQGFPDDWTLIPYRKGEASDSNRYRALGNSMAVPVMRWIGARIAQVDGEGIRIAVEAIARDTPNWLDQWSGREDDS